jgi:hypothetical protein
MRFVGEHPVFGAAGAFAFLAADFLDAGALGVDVTFPHHFDLVEQKASGDEPVQSLLPGGLAFHLQARGTMEKHDTGGGLVDILSSVPARTNERFLDVRIEQSERGHAPGELSFLFRADGEQGHGVSLVKGPGGGNN